MSAHGAANGDGARRRARQAAGADHQHAAEAAGADRRQDLARPRPRRAGRRRRRQGGRQRPPFPRPDPPACGGAPGTPDRDFRRKRRACSIRRAASSRRCRSLAAIPSTSSTPTRSGSTASGSNLDAAGACLGHGADGYSGHARRSRPCDRSLQGNRLPHRCGRPARARQRRAGWADLCRRGDRRIRASSPERRLRRNRSTSISTAPSPLAGSSA